MNENVKHISGRARVFERKEEVLKLPSLSCGLEEKDVLFSRSKYGTNCLTSRKRAGFIKQFFRNLNDPIIKILIGALLINTIFTFSDMNWAESIGIAATVLISTLVTTISEHSSGASFEKLYSTLGDTTCRILRSGKEVLLTTSEIVRYDLVYLYPGDTVPADGILMQGEISCDESALTGESRAVKKTVDAGAINTLRQSGEYQLKTGNATAIFKGSHVVSGSGILLVLAVGDSTVYGSIATELSGDDGVSPLKNKLSRLAKTISKIGYISAAVVALVHLADAFWFDAGCSTIVALSRLADSKFVFSELIHALTMAISIIVVAVPEGLPMMITVVLSSNMKKMMKSGVLVRRLVGIETAGSVDILFTDKTGTITTGQLSVSRVITPFGEYDKTKAIPRPILQSLKLGGVACSSVNNQTERAISSFLELKIPRQAIAPSDMIPFDSARKFAAAKSGGKLYVRGAGEYLLPCCASYLDETGTIKQMTNDIRAKIENTINEYASRSFRVLAHCEGDECEFNLLKSQGLSSSCQLTFVSLYVIRDEIRDEIVSSIDECHSAGIQVVMLTGDNHSTAAGIGIECGILARDHDTYLSSNGADYYITRGKELVIDGQELKNMSDVEIIKLMPLIRVISRVTPTDKSRLVRLAKESGHVTGMTGDGINDAPALKSADVGFAMGSGTDIARESGDIVITDDNFVSITKAVLFGRTIFSSIRKFITFQLTMNLAAVGVSLLGTIFGIESPVTVIQMLWVNIIMDTLGSLAFAGEPALKETMRNSPVKRDENILNSSMICQILLTGGYAILMSMFFLLSDNVRHMFGGGEIYHLTLFFALFVFMGVGIAMCTRTPRINLLSGIRKNKAFTVIMPAVAAIQLLIIYFGGEVFRCVPIKWNELLICAAFAMTVIIADTIRKSIFAIIRINKKRT